MKPSSVALLVVGCLAIVVITYLFLKSPKFANPYIGLNQTPTSKDFAYTGIERESAAPSVSNSIDKPSCLGTDNLSYIFSTPDGISK